MPKNGAKLGVNSLDGLSASVEAMFEVDFKGLVEEEGEEVSSVRPVHWRPPRS